MSDEPMVERLEVSVQNGTVCVVTERRKPGAAGISTPGDSLFGVFTDEETARKEYGTIDGDYIPTFDMVPLWSSPALLSQLREQREALERIASDKCVVAKVSWSGTVTCEEMWEGDPDARCPVCIARTALAALAPNPDREGR